MSWEASIDSSLLTIPVSVPGVSHFQGVCSERGRDVEYEVQGYLELITWKWKARVVDVVTGIEASAAGYLSKNGAMEEAIKNLFDKLEQCGNPPAGSECLTDRAYMVGSTTVRVSMSARTLVMVCVT